MNMKSIFAAAALATLASAGIAQEQSLKPVDEIKGQRLGTLNCTVEGGWGLLIGSSKGVTCEFKHANGAVEEYTGSLDKLGLDIGVTEESYMTWIVFTTAENKPGDYALEGTYAGVSAQGSLGIGLGANALIGGSGKQIGLQPVSVEGVKGLNVAVGLSSLTLTADKG